MRLDEHYTLESDHIQWTLKYNKSYMEDGKLKTTKRDFFYVKLKDALVAYIDKKLKEAETVDEAIVMLKDELLKLNQIEWNQEIK